MTRLGTGRRLALVAAVAAVIGGCGGPSTTKYPVGNDNAKQSGDPYKTVKEARGGIFQEGGIAAEFSPYALFGGGSDDAQPAAAPSTSGIQVNGYLWGAALDTVSFMPLQTVDPEAGLIVTGWYTSPDKPKERFKLNVFILSGELRDDGVRVAVFRQLKGEGGDWVDVEPIPGAASGVESVIYTRAKNLQLARAS
jgi:hypothetical protein